MILFCVKKRVFYTFSVIFPCNLFESNVKFSVIFQLSCPCNITAPAVFVLHSLEQDGVYTMTELFFSLLSIPPVRCLFVAAERLFSALRDTLLSLLQVSSQRFTEMGENEQNGGRYKEHSCSRSFFGLRRKNTRPPVHCRHE